MLRRVLSFLLVAVALNASAANPQNQTPPWADLVDSVYRLKGIHQTAMDIKKTCGSLAPQHSVSNQQSYDKWRSKQAPVLAEVAAGYEQSIHLITGGDARKRKQVLAEDAATEKRALTRTQQTLGALSKDVLAAKCTAYPSYVQRLDDSVDPYIATQLRTLRENRGRFGRK